MRTSKARLIFSMNAVGVTVSEIGLAVGLSTSRVPQRGMMISRCETFVRRAIALSAARRLSFAVSRATVERRPPRRLGYCSSFRWPRARGREALAKKQPR